MAKYVLPLCQPICDIFLAVILASISISLRQTIQPFQRGFFCGDENLQYPYKSSTISVTVLYCVGFILPFLTILIVEFIRIFKRKPTTDVNYRNILLKKWAQTCFQLLIIFFFGVSLAHLTTNVFKYSLGRLRPHFLTVCQPDYSKFNCTGYIEEPHCTGDITKIQQARVAFPSGHASSISYTMFFTALYLQLRFTWEGVMLLKPFLQTWICYIAIYTCLSRVSDYKHHWSDVAVGAVIGVLVALFMMYKVQLYFRNYEKAKDTRSVKSTTSNTTAL